MPGSILTTEPRTAFERDGYAMLRALFAAEEMALVLDPSTRDNGCLQVMKGSHHCGRVGHGVLPGDQVGADPKRMEQMLTHPPIEFPLGGECGQ